MYLRVPVRCNICHKQLGGPFQDIQKHYRDNHRGSKFT